MKKLKALVIGNLPPLKLKGVVLLNVSQSAIYRLLLSHHLLVPTKAYRISRQWPVCLTLWVCFFIIPSFLLFRQRWFLEALHIQKLSDLFCLGRVVVVWIWNCFLLFRFQSSLLLWLLFQMELGFSFNSFGLIQMTFDEGTWTNIDRHHIKSIFLIAYLPVLPRVKVGSCSYHT